MEKPEFDNQKLILEHDGFRIELKYESQYLENKLLAQEKYNQKIEVSDSQDSILGIRIFINDKEINSSLISGINGGIWLSVSTERKNGQSVKCDNNDLILSLGFNLISIQIPTLKLNWNIKPDQAEIFEFYDLEDDILLRSELEIHRIDLNGNIKSSYGGRDIWVNIEGKAELTF